ncbi:serine/threonine protein kinase [Myxococcota bacterium]|nr:serine/threonine protein kinase [Myxococcota bacterium]MBU1380749.1 serine/threonine protein kinase [Myxococcota bacterium]MBU1498023.1 serine/threonine protein kinase [Myxococcota bacterium]
MSLVKPVKFENLLIVEGLNLGHSIEVFRAVETNSEYFDGFVALHRVHPGVKDLKATTQKLFREMKVLQALNHPGIPRYEHTGKSGDSYFFTREYVWGKSLLQMFRQLRDLKKLMAPHQAVLIAFELARVLEYAWSVRLDIDGRRISHLNINPRNVILSFDGDVKVAGFGLEPVSLNAANLERFDFRTIGYIAPEIISKPSDDTSADIFSVGAILYEMLTGMPAFLDKNARAVLSRIKKSTYTPPERIIPGIDRELTAIISKCLSIDPADRFRSPGELARILEGWLKKRRPDYNRRNLSKLIKGLFINDVKYEIKVFYDLFYDWRGEGASLLKAVPVMLYHRFNQTPREVTEPPTVEDEEKTKEMFGAPELDIEDNEETRLLGEDPDYYNEKNEADFEKSTKIGILRKGQSFEPEKKIRVTDSTALPSLDEEETRLVDDDDDFPGITPQVKPASNIDLNEDETRLLDDETSSRYGRRPTLYFKTDESLSEQFKKTLEESRRRDAANASSDVPPPSRVPSRSPLPAASPARQTRPSNPPPPKSVPPPPVQPPPPQRIHQGQVESKFQVTDRTKNISAMILTVLIGGTLFFLTIWLLTRFA